MAAKRVLRYLQGTTHHGIIFHGAESENCIGYSDADWAGDRDDRKSTSGYLFKIKKKKKKKIAGGPVSWRSKKQETVALSSAEAEYIALSSAAQECMWMRRLTNFRAWEPTRGTNHHPGGQPVGDLNGQISPVPWESQTHLNTS